jgi:hypothetical protein
MSKKTMSHEPQKQEKRPEETKKPANLRANARPCDGFVLSVDGKWKTRYEIEKDAMEAGAKLKQSYPVLQIAIYDAVERIYTPVGSAGSEQEPATVEHDPQ